MTKPNCVVKNSARKMMLVDMFVDSEMGKVEAKAGEWRQQGLTVRVTKYRIGPHKDPITMHKATAYRKEV